MRMRLLLLLIISSFSFTSLASTSNTKSVTAYYSSAMGLSGFKLKTALSSQLRRTHQDRGYGSLLTVYLKSDADTSYDNDGSIMDMYSENPSSYDPYTFSSKKQSCGSYKRESDCFNREHLFPQSAFGKSRPMRNDFFHVYPSDGYVNGKRSNHAFGEVNNPRWTSQNGSKVGPNASGKFRGTVFEPIDEFKGDIARALLYFGTRYEDRIGSFNHAMLDGSRDKVYAGWFMKLLLKWHKQDPVSKHEIQRNEVGYKYQGNRNPFIDHPEWVESIWGTLK